jgi:hypothetical protein
MRWSGPVDSVRLHDGRVLEPRFSFSCRPTGLATRCCFRRAASGRWFFQVIHCAAGQIPSVF